MKQVYIKPITEVYKVAPALMDINSFKVNTNTSQGVDEEYILGKENNGIWVQSQDLWDE